MDKYINEWGIECYKDVLCTDLLSEDLFHTVENGRSEAGEWQKAFHSNLGSITVLHRLTGFGWFDTETGYRDVYGRFWLACGNVNVLEQDCATIESAISFIKRNANTCVGV